MLLVVGHAANAADTPTIGEPPAISPSDTLTLNLWLGRAEQGAAEAQFTVGYMYATGKGAQLDYNEAAKWFRLAAEQNHARAQLSIGMLYDNGWGVVRDRMEAFRWYLLAAEKGEPQAQTNLGAFYIEGLVGEPNPSEAIRWFRRAAVQGSPRAMISLGSIYAEGLGVMRDHPRALMWMFFALQTFNANGTPNAQLQLAVDRLIQGMSLQQLDEAARLGELCEQSKYTMCE